MCKYLQCNCGRICVNYGGTIDVVAGIALVCLKEYLIPESQSAIHNYILIGTAVFLITKGLLILLALHLRKKVRLAVLTYLLVTTAFLFLATGYVIYCGIQKFIETQENFREKPSAALQKHANYILIVIFVLTCPIVFLLMWHVQLYMFLYYRKLNRSRNYSFR